MNIISFLQQSNGQISKTTAKYIRQKHNRSTTESLNVLLSFYTGISTYR